MSNGATGQYSRVNFFAGRYDPNLATMYYHEDQLGTSRLMISHNGYPVWQGTFLPYGEEYNPQMTMNHFKFTGKERDSESGAPGNGLDYFGARYYSNALGRFITPDWTAKATAVPYAEFADPQSLNLYSYVRNIPTVNVDADGHCDFCQRLWNKLTGNGWVTDAELTEQHRQQLISDFKARPDFQKELRAMKPAQVDKLWDCLNSDACTQQMINSNNAAQQSAVPPMVPGERVVHRDATGRIHADIPEYPDPNMTKAELEEQAEELRESIKAREIDNAQKGGDGSPKGPQHRARIDEEREYLRQIENRLKGMK